MFRGNWIPQIEAISSNYHFNTHWPNLNALYLTYLTRYYMKPYHNILLIDDDLDDQEIFMMAVGKVSSSAICNTMSNAREALENLNSSPTHPDVIFLDLNMPIMTGQEFLIKIKQCQNLARIPVIIFSTSSNQTTKDLTKNLGAESFITKPQLLEDLIAILQPIIN